MHLTRSKHLVQAGQRLRRAGEDHQATDGTVKTMHDAEEDVARLLVLLLQVGLHRLRQRLVARLAALHYLAAALRNDDDVVVLVDDLHICEMQQFCVQRY